MWDVALFVVFGFFYYMLHNTLQALAADLAPTARGSAVSLFAFSMFTAQGIGPVVVGQMLDAASPTPVLVGLGLVLAGVGLTAERVLFRAT
jgi:MFS family permease